MNGLLEVKRRFRRVGEKGLGWESIWEGGKCMSGIVSDGMDVGVKERWLLEMVLRFLFGRRGGE